MAHQKGDRTQAYSSRQSMMDVLDDEIIRAKRYVKPLSMLLISIARNGDGGRSKEKAEREGFLRQVAELFTRNVRAIDRIYLYQDGVFAVLLPETDKVEALSTAKRLRKIAQTSRSASPGA